MIIRDYEKSDFVEVEELWKETGIYHVERGDTREIIERCNRTGGKFLVMVEQTTGRIAGTSWMSWDGRRIHLHHFAIRPSLQGKGLGRRLALESLRFARQRGCPVKLEVHRDNIAAIRLYKSLGFIPFENYSVYMRIDPAGESEP